MRVLFYLPTLGQAGPDRVVSLVASAMAESLSFEVHVVVNVEGGQGWDALGPSLVRHTLSTSLGERISASQYPVRRFAALVDRVKPDVVVATLRSIVTVAAARRLGLINCAFVARPANHFTQNALALGRIAPLKHVFSSAIYLAAVASADLIICQSGDIASDLSRYRVPRKRMVTISNPVEVFDAPTRGSVDSRSPACRFLAVGRLAEQKGFDLLVDAMMQVVLVEPAVQLRLVGEGPQRAKLESLISRYGLSNQISLVGQVANPRALMASSDWLISSSRYEGFPNVILEALSVGTPVVATDCPGGTKEVHREGVTGYLVPPLDTGALAEAIIKATRTREQFDSNRMVSDVTERFGLPAIARQYASAIESAMVGRGRIRGV